MESFLSQIQEIVATRAQVGVQRIQSTGTSLSKHLFISLEAADGNFFPRKIRIVFNNPNKSEFICIESNLGEDLNTRLIEKKRKTSR